MKAYDLDIQLKAEYKSYLQRKINTGSDPTFATFEKAGNVYTCSGLPVRKSLADSLLKRGLAKLKASPIPNTKGPDQAGSSSSVVRSGNKSQKMERSGRSELAQKRLEPPQRGPEPGQKRSEPAQKRLEPGRKPSGQDRDTSNPGYGYEGSAFVQDALTAAAPTTPQQHHQKPSTPQRVSAGKQRQFVVPPLRSQHSGPIPPTEILNTPKR